jgi:hypothetical protein
MFGDKRFDVGKEEGPHDIEDRMRIPSRLRE